ncbi:MAG: site-2 protease family protein [Candidatus Micrarchaeaceae archaeon]
MFRENLKLSRELEDMLIADLVLAVAFDFAFNGGIEGLPSTGGALLFFPIALVAVTFSFVLHEYMHKVVAQHYGALAAFRKSNTGLLITLLTGIFGFIIGLPGATVIYTNSFTKKEDAYVSLAGPLTNFAVFAVFLTLDLLPFHINYLHEMFSFTMLVSIILAFFNMLPIFPLDGSKVFRWNKIVYFAVIASIFAMLLLIFPIESLIIGLVFMLVFAFIISMFTRAVLF